jgi:hypothetical protein
MFNTNYYDLGPSPAGGFPRKRISSYVDEVLGPPVSRTVSSEEDYTLGVLRPLFRVVAGMLRRR